MTQPHRRSDEDRARQGYGIPYKIADDRMDSVTKEQMCRVGQAMQDIGQMMWQQGTASLEQVVEAVWTWTNQDYPADDEMEAGAKLLADVHIERAYYFNVAWKMIKTRG